MCKALQKLCAITCPVQSENIQVKYILEKITKILNGAKAETHFSSYCTTVLSPVVSYDDEFYSNHYGHPFNGDDYF